MVVIRPPASTESAPTDPDAGIGANPDDGLPRKDEGCSQAGGGLSVLGALAALRLWRRRAA